MKRGSRPDTLSGVSRAIGRLDRVECSKVEPLSGLPRSEGVDLRRSALGAFAAARPNTACLGGVSARERGIGIATIST
jgi:hypothetical protein